MDLNPANWNWNQAKAAGKHVTSYAAGGVTVAVALHFISGSQGTDITGNINDIVSGLEQVAKGVAGLTATGLTIYNMYRSANNASPDSQIKSVAATLSTPTAVQPTPELRKEIINAVGKMPEVRAVVAPSVADQTDSNKVVSTPAEVQALPQAKVA